MLDLVAATKLLGGGVWSPPPPSPVFSGDAPVRSFKFTNNIFL